MKRYIKALNIVIIVFTILFCLCQIYDIIDIIETYKFERKFDEKFEKYNQLKDDQEKKYSEILKKYTNLEKNTIPYVIEGFKVVEDKVENGLVIEDTYGSQFVWIPCDKKTLKKFDINVTSNISAYDCYDIEFEEFFESVLQNGGFYVSRFEIGKKDDLIVSKKSAEPITNITRDEAIKITSSMFKENTKIKSSLLNGYAYDSMLKWSMDGRTIKECQVLNQNGKSTKNIYKLFDDIFEMTLENYYEYIVYRGNFQNLENMNSLQFVENRMIAEKKSKSDKIGFRTMLYQIEGEQP